MREQGRSQVRVVKRLMDIAVAAPLLLVTSPVLFVSAVAIRLSSPGPALFSQLRLGLDEKPFRCHKLRTMHVGTPSLPTHEAPQNAVTTVGRMLRKFKVDELPQLWNVLCGDMSLIGPRPCLPTQEALIAHRRRLGIFSLLPGVSGLAQVRGIDMSDPLLCAETDAEYRSTASFGLDMRILLRTFYPG